MPREHGSWSLALEPLALGLLLAPTASGGWLAAAAFAGFLTRRPLKIARRETQLVRRRAARRALIFLAGAALIFGALAVSSAANGFLFWLLPAVLLGGIFLWFDLQNEGREEAAEICGSAAFATLTGVMIAAAGHVWGDILIADFLMLSRAVPTVLLVRAIVRGNKAGVVHPAAAFTAALSAALIAALLAMCDALPVATAILVALLLLRAAIFLGGKRKLIRARTLGLQELVIGIVYLSVAAATWRP